MGCLESTVDHLVIHKDMVFSGKFNWVTQFYWICMVNVGSRVAMGGRLLGEAARSFPGVLQSQCQPAPDGLTTGQGQISQIEGDP